MERRIPVNGELYRHFKNKLYQIVTVATHTETGEKLVVYQALYDDYQVYARPLEQFMSETDHVKYPEAAQKYRFERLPGKDEGAKHKTGSGESETKEPGHVRAERTEYAESGEQAAVSSDSGTGRQDSEVNPLLMDFLDADTMEEKYKILVSMRECITDQMINNMAVVLDVVIPEGRLDDRYDALKICIRTKQRYESCHRLR